MKCIVCGKETTKTIWPDRDRFTYKKYCSESCRSKLGYRKYLNYYKQYNKSKNKRPDFEEKRCDICGSLFKPLYQHQKRCSLKCVKESKLRWKHKKVLESHKPTECPYCKNIFTPETLQQKFCSNKCMSNQHNTLKGINVGYGGTEHTCLICKKVFPATMSSQKYCGKKCRRKADYLNNTESKIHNGRLRRVLKKKLGGTYTLQQWNDLVKECGGVCNRCGEKTKMTVDHIIPLSKWEEWAKEHNPTYLANDIDNIQPLCLTCNIKKNNKID